MNGPYFPNFFPNLLMPYDFLLENMMFYYYNVTVEMRLSPCPGLTFVVVVVIVEGYGSPYFFSGVCSTVFTENVFLAMNGH